MIKRYVEMFRIRHGAERSLSSIVGAVEQVEYQVSRALSAMQIDDNSQLPVELEQSESDLFLKHSQDVLRAYHTQLTTVDRDSRIAYKRAKVIQSTDLLDCTQDAAQCLRSSCNNLSRILDHYTNLAHDRLLQLSNRQKSPVTAAAPLTPPSRSAVKLASPQPAPRPKTSPSQQQSQTPLPPSAAPTVELSFIHSLSHPKSSSSFLPSPKSPKPQPPMSPAKTPKNKFDDIFASLTLDEEINQAKSPKVSVLSTTSDSSLPHRAKQPLSPYASKRRRSGSNEPRVRRTPSRTALFVPPSTQVFGV